VEQFGSLALVGQLAGWMPFGSVDVVTTSRKWPSQ
jgi:hypothetical protein